MKALDWIFHLAEGADVLLDIVLYQPMVDSFVLNEETKHDDDDDDCCYDVVLDWRTDMDATGNGAVRDNRVFFVERWFGTKQLGYEKETNQQQNWNESQTLPQSLMGSS